MMQIKTISRSSHRSGCNSGVSETRVLMRIKHEGVKGFFLSVMTLNGRDVEFSHYCSLPSVTRTDAEEAEDRIMCYREGGKETKKAKEKIEEMLLHCEELSYED